MIGYIEATRGEAFIGGHDMTTGMNEIYKIMGVCPQHDLLWERLTSREHLNFYARLKGLRGTDMKATVDAALASVQLLDVGNKQVQKYSGGALFKQHAADCFAPGLYRVWTMHQRCRVHRCCIQQPEVCS